MRDAAESRSLRDGTARGLALTALIGAVISCFVPLPRSDSNRPSTTGRSIEDRSESLDDSSVSEPSNSAERSGKKLSTDVQLPADEISWRQMAEQTRRVQTRSRSAVVRIAIPSSQSSDRETTDLGSPRPLATERSEAVQGSGLVFESDGRIVTNYHVVRQASTVDVQFDDGRPFTAQVIAVDPVIDLAIVQVDAKNLSTIEWADSDRVQAGDFVWALGYPFGWRQSLSFGIVSAVPQASPTGSETPPLASFLQSDVAIHPGHSGGCWLDADGRVIGLATSIVGKSFQGLSYAIPSNVVRQALQRMQGERSGED